MLRAHHDFVFLAAPAATCQRITSVSSSQDSVNASAIVGASPAERPGRWLDTLRLEASPPKACRILGVTSARLIAVRWHAPNPADEQSLVTIRQILVPQTRGSTRVFNSLGSIT